MKKRLLLVSGAILFYLSACTSSTSSTENSIPADSVTIGRGELVFTENCGSCHSFATEAIGPQLNGLTTIASTDWIKKFINNPTAMIDAGDERAKKLYEKYKTVMPSFAHLPEDKVNDLIAFIHAQKVQEGREPEDPNALKNPIPEGIDQSTLVVALKKIVELPNSAEEDPRTRLNKIGYQPNSDQVFILDHRGKLYVLDQKNKPVVYMDMAELKPNFINKPGLATGFGSFAFHPEFDKNGLFYTSNAEPKGTKKADFFYNDTIPVALQWVITEWKTKTPRAIPFVAAGEGRELFRIDMVSQIHGMQELTFNPLAKVGDEDYGLLYVGIGDGGAVENGFPFIANSMERLWGKVIRIDPAGNNSINKQYGIPATNPYAKSDDATIAREIYASGFRNPHRISWTKTGQIITSNVGHGNIESVYLLLPGHNYGWPLREGTFVHKEYGNMFIVYPPKDSSGISRPIAEYDHDEGKAVSGGYEYWGKSVPALEGKYIFGDMNFGRLFYIDMKDVRDGELAKIKEWHVTVDGKPTTMAELCGNKRVDLRFGRDRQGELYVFTKPGGTVYKLVSAKQ